MIILFEMFELCFQTTEKTKNALEQLVQSKIAAALPVRAADKTGPAQYIRSVRAPTASSNNYEYVCSALEFVINM